MSDANRKEPRRIIVAEGSEYERSLPLLLPRGKMARGSLPKILHSIDKLQFIQNDAGEVVMENFSQALEVLFGIEDFEDFLLPLVFGFLNPITGNIDKKDAEWLSMLTDNEIVEAYVPFAMFIASNGRQAEEVDAALKKSRAARGKVSA